MKSIFRGVWRSPVQIGVWIAILQAYGCGEANRVEEPDLGGIEGTLHVRIADFEDHSETYYRLVRPDGESIALEFAEKAPPIQPGERIVVRGQQLEGRLQVESFAVLPADDRRKAGRLETGGPKTLKIALLNASTQTNAALEMRAKTAPDSPTAFYRDNSYGDWKLQIDVFGPYSVPIAGCDVDKIAADIKSVASAAGVDLKSYDNFMYFLPKTQSCGWGGLANVGVNAARGFENGNDSWYNNASDCVVFAQELAHNYGLLHSHSCSAPPYTTKDWDSTSCPSFSEYGDQYTPMGDGCGHFNAPEMGEMGYISGCNVLAVTSSGSYELGPIEMRCAGAQVLQIPGAPKANQVQQYIYVEYRKGSGTVGSDKKSPPGIFFHASSEFGGARAPSPPSPDVAYIVDPFFIHAPLSNANDSWTEPTSGATFTLKAIGDTATVQVTMQGGGGGAAKCVDGTTPPPSPSCGTNPPDGGGSDGAAGTGGAGGAGGRDASTDVGTGGVGGSSGSGGVSGASGSGGRSGSGGASGGSGGTGGSAGIGGVGGAGAGAGGGGVGGAMDGGRDTGNGGLAGRGGSGGGGAGGSSGSSGAPGRDAGVDGSVDAGGSRGGASGAADSGAKGGRAGSGGGGSGSTNDDGCSCMVPGRRPTSDFRALLLGLAGLLATLRRRTLRLAP